METITQTTRAVSPLRTHAPVTPRTRRPRAGFTLVELMIALGVLMVAVMATFSSQVTSFNLTTTSRETQTAISDLETCMEQLLLERERA